VSYQHFAQDKVWLLWIRLLQSLDVLDTRKNTRCVTALAYIGSFTVNFLCKTNIFIKGRSINIFANYRNIYLMKKIIASLNS
jgi:hypothetical protein